MVVPGKVDLEVSLVGLPSAVENALQKLMAEKKPASVLKPEILSCIHLLLTEEQKVARWKDALGIAA